MEATLSHLHQFITALDYLNKSYGNLILLETVICNLKNLNQSLYEQFSSFEQSFVTEVSQFKSDFLCQKSSQ